MKYKISDYIYVKHQGIGKITYLGNAYGNEFMTIEFSHTSWSYYLDDRRLEYIGSKNKRVLIVV